MNDDAAGVPATGCSWRIGQLAEATGLSVRSLRHYDEIGLFCPSGRNATGHRRYTETDVRRLHRIVALRGFGLSLAQTGQLLDNGTADPLAVLRQQLARAQERSRSRSGSATGYWARSVRSTTPPNRPPDNSSNSSR